MQSVRAPNRINWLLNIIGGVHTYEEHQTLFNLILKTLHFNMSEDYVLVIFI